MKKTYKLLQIILLIYINHLSAFSQLPQSPASVLSPNAASLGLYGNVPVSYYTGVPEINIPLYDISCYNFQLPLSLSYHSSGIQPDQHPGWTGLGWSLNAGGVITRVVKDMPDDYNNPNYFAKNAGYYFGHDILNTPLWNQRSYLREVAQNIEKVEKDTEPDEFSFKFGEYSGRFFLDHTGSWVVQCSKPVKVMFNNKFLDIPFNKDGTRASAYGYSPSFNGFTIITDDGIEYVFGGNTSSIDYSIDFFEQAIDDWVATAWYLTKIILPNKQEINFMYERDRFINQMYIAVNHDLGSITEAEGGGIFNPQPECSSWNYTSIEASYQGKLIAPVYLRDIVVNDMHVLFERNISEELNYDNSIYNWKYMQWIRNYNGYSFLPILKSNPHEYLSCLNDLKWCKLNRIIIKSGIGDIYTVKSIKFSYNDNPSQRLTLTSITESGKKSYEFKYDNLENLPPYLSNKTDHWGYFNNTYAYLDYNNYYSYKNPNAISMKYGTLNKIIYPTGGYTEFEFEPHEYGKQISIKRWESCDELTNNVIAGGLRIKRIKNYSMESATPSTREFFYISDYPVNKSGIGKSSGILGGRIQYYFTNYIVYAFNDNNLRRQMSAFSSISVLSSCNNANGSHIGYSEVVEKREDNSFTRYKFTNFDNGYMDESADAIIQESRTAYEPYTSKEQERGNLILQEEYNSEGKMIRDKVIIYEKDNDSASSNYVRTMNARHKNVCPETAVSFDEGTSSKIYTYKMRPIEETETFHDPTTGLALQINRISYQYTDNKLLRSVLVNNSNGNEYKTEFKYPSDYSTTFPYNEMIQKNILNTVVFEMKSNDWQIIKSEKYNYDKFHATFYAPVNQQIFNINKRYFETRIIYNYDSKGNVCEINKDGNDKTVYLWSYNYQYPIAEIKGAAYTEVKTALGYTNDSQVEALATQLNPDVNTLSTKLRAYFKDKPILISTYTYKPLVGMLTATDPSGKTIKYEYDDFNRLKCIRDLSGKIIESYNYHYQNQ